MTILGIAQIVIFFALVLAITKPIGVFMFRVFEGERTFLHPILRPVERLIYWLGGVREDIEQSWVRYSASIISFSVLFLFTYGLQRLQGLLPFNPQHLSTAVFPRMPPHDSGSRIQHGRELHDQHEWQAYYRKPISYLCRWPHSRSELRFRRRRSPLLSR